MIPNAIPNVQNTAIAESSRISFRLLSHSTPKADSTAKIAVSYTHLDVYKRQGYYMRPRTDRNELEKYHEGLIVCSACIGGEVPKKIINDQLEEAEEAIRWYKNLFGDDYYLELQRHKATVSRANHEAYPMQQKANAKLLEYAQKYNIKVICSNDVHFVDEENAEAHDRLICLSTGKDLDDPTRMLYTKQEWMKTKACLLYTSRCV